jgi:hypothetical protein
MMQLSTNQLLRNASDQHARQSVEDGLTGEGCESWGFLLNLLGETHYEKWLEIVCQARRWIGEGDGQGEVPVHTSFRQG